MLPSHLFELVGILVVFPLMKLTGQINLLTDHSLKHKIVRARGESTVKSDVILPPTKTGSYVP